MISRSTLVKIVLVFLVVQVLLYEIGAFSALFKKPRSTNRDIEFEKSNWYDDTEDTAGTENTIASKANNTSFSKPQSTNQDYDSKKSNLHETTNTGWTKNTGISKPRSTNQNIESEKSNWYDDTEDTAGTENTIASKANNIGLSKVSDRVDKGTVFAQINALLK
uniref:Uncharacterized protein n=1 Tax=Amphimedon queenslandica TaxID=400682 RepID=A0A1X7U8E0_AMPQE